MIRLQPPPDELSDRARWDSCPRSLTVFTLNSGGLNGHLAAHVAVASKGPVLATGTRARSKLNLLASVQDSGHIIAPFWREVPCTPALT